MSGKRKKAAVRNMPHVRSRSKPKLEVNVMRVAGKWSQSLPGYGPLILGWCDLALAQATQGAASVVLADNAFVQNLNHTYRGKNKATNVLAFPGGQGELGDVVLAYETVKEEARAQKKSFRRHTAHLVVHGCLHLCGYDHEKEKDAQAMEALETSILARLGFPDPYRAVA
jgi:probable rRNA maturation factor